MRKYKHWIWFSTLKIEKVKQFLKEGSNFSIINIYPHPSKLTIYILEIVSTDNYDNLDLNVNDGWGILHRYSRKPKLLGKPVTEKFVEIYGLLPKLVLNKN